jgi:membrane fusion protein (multidrug efflux system)
MNTRRWIITIVSCLLIFCALAGFKVWQIKKAIAFGESFPEPSATVEAEEVKSFNIQSREKTIGEIVSPQTVTLRNEIEGRIVSVNFSSGEIVKQGDILLQLDISEEAARLDAAKARANLARLDLNRIKKLLKEKTVSREQVDKAEAELSIASAEVTGIQALIDKKTIKAPFSAKAGLHLFEVGQFLDRNSIITTLVGINNFHWVDFSLSLAKSVDVEVGTSVEVTVPSVSAEPLTGKIIARDSVASNSSRNLRFRAMLNTETEIPSHTLAAVNVITGMQEVVEIPITALRNDSGGFFVYRLIPDAESGAYRGKRQQLTIGEERGDMVVIISGLEVGDLIATQGAFKVHDGLLVYVAERPTDKTHLANGE